MSDQPPRLKLHQMIATLIALVLAGLVLGALLTHLNQCTHGRTYLARRC